MHSSPLIDSTAWGLWSHCRVQTVVFAPRFPLLLTYVTLSVNDECVRITETNPRDNATYVSHGEVQR